MDRKAKIIWIAIGIIVLLSSVFIVYEQYNGNFIAAYGTEDNQTVEEAAPGTELNKSEVKADTAQMIEIMERTHPIFLEGEPEKYKEAKARFLRETNKKMTIDDFRLSVSRYLSSIQDGHTRIAWVETSYLDVNWKYINGKLLILDEKNKATDKIVTKINGVDIQKIFKTIDELFPAENYAAAALNYAQYSRGVKVLAYSGVDCTKNMVLTVKSGTSEENIQTKLSNEGSLYSANFEISSKKIDDRTIYVKFGTCDINTDLNKVADDLKQALKNGTRNVIIDVMDNPGGNSQACNILLDALKIKPGQFGCVMRYSPLAQKKYGYSKTSGFVTSERSNDAVPNTDINLYVITNEETFSSAQMLATWVKDGKLGTIVGRPSSNMPSSFGDILTFQLKNSGLKGQISFKKWTRPDKTKDSERVLEPDIYVDYSEDALSKIMALIAAR